jgi:hypothetical protein
MSTEPSNIEKRSAIGDGVFAVQGSLYQKGFLLSLLLIMIPLRDHPRPRRIIHKEHGFEAFFC